MCKLQYYIFCIYFFSNSIATAGSYSHYVVDDQDFYPRNAAKESLGKLLMFDKILSGNKNISCASCHHPFAATSDGLSLGVGEGGRGTGVTRNTGIGEQAITERVPRNSPHLFNLGAKEFSALFHDGRVAVDDSQPGGFLSPAAEQLPAGLDNALAAQAMFPVTSTTEMAGQAGENAIADAAAINNLDGTNGVWDLLALRLQANAEYVELFSNAFDDIDKASDISYIHAANAIAAFEAAAWRCTDTLFDQYVKAPDINKVSLDLLEGASIFYDSQKGNCASCHSGPFQTDQDFHAIGMPQIGPGKGDNQVGYTDGHDDFGREIVTNDPADRFRFRTPSLRQVAFTGPWGHDGAFNSLEAVIKHHLDPAKSINHYPTEQAVLPPRADLNQQDFVVQQDPSRRQAITEAAEITPMSLTDDQIRKLIIFLEQGLTDFSCVDLRKDVPVRVPSNLPIGD